MSDRELRDCLEWARALDMGLQRTKLVAHRESALWGVACQKALAQPPDLVGLLQEIEERLVAVGSWLREDVGLASHDGYVGMQAALNSLQDYIQETVRLIDEPPGWEYTDDQP